MDLKKRVELIVYIYGCRNLFLCLGTFFGWVDVDLVKIVRVKIKRYKINDKDKYVIMNEDLIFVIFKYYFFLKIDRIFWRNV